MINKSNKYKSFLIKLGSLFLLLILLFVTATITSYWNDLNSFEKRLFLNGLKWFVVGLGLCGLVAIGFYLGKRENRLTVNETLQTFGGVLGAIPRMGNQSTHYNIENDAPYMQPTIPLPQVTDNSPVKSLPAPPNSLPFSSKDLFEKSNAQQPDNLPNYQDYQ